MPGVTGVVLVGVAPQPVIAAARLLAEAALAAGLDASCAELPPPLPRSGPAGAHVRFGSEVRSPTVRAGAADVLVAFEQGEALRAAHLLAPGGLAVLDQAVVPTWRMRAALDPPPSDVAARLRALGPRVVEVRAASILPPRADPALGGLVLLGVASCALTVPLEAFVAALEAGGRAGFVERRQAFLAGRELFALSPITAA